jgi:formylglycine-generating enzyme required for sulfatase activity
MSVQALERITHTSAPSGDMIFLPGGTFRMGSDRHYPEEAPAHRVTVE